MTIQTLQTWRRPKNPPNCQTTPGPAGGRVVGPDGSAVGAVPSSLDPTETSSRVESILAEQQAREHSRVARSRRTVLGALAWQPGDGGDDVPDADGKALERRYWRIWYCRRNPWIWQTAEALPTVVWKSCRDRLCPRCQAERSRRVATDVERLLRSFASPRFVTLTMRAGPGSLGSRIDRIYSCFRRLRRTDAFGKRVLGGVATLEVTRGKQGGHWHVHLHFVYDGEFFPHALLKRKWHEITGDSFVVDIRAVHSRTQAARYMAKYVAKAADVYGWTREHVREYALAMHGRRLVLTWGSCHGQESKGRPEEGPTPGGRPVRAAGEVLYWALKGCQDAREAVRLARRVGGPFARILGASPEPGQAQGGGGSAAEYQQLLTHLVRVGAGVTSGPDPPH